MNVYCLCACLFCNEFASVTSSSPRSKEVYIKLMMAGDNVVMEGLSGVDVIESVANLTSSKSFFRFFGEEATSTDDKEVLSMLIEVSVEGNCDCEGNFKLGIESTGVLVVVIVDAIVGVIIVVVILLIFSMSLSIEILEVVGELTADASRCSLISEVSGIHVLVVG